MRIRSLFFLPVLLIVVLVGQGCEDTKPSPAADDEIRGAVTLYLHQLAEAYSNLSVAPIESIATAREVSDVRKILKQLVSTGDRLEAKLLSVDFDAVSVFREVNATVTTTEVWDVTRYDSGTGIEKGRNPTSVQKSVLQLRLIDGRWRVVARRVMETQGGSKWTVPDHGEKAQSPAGEKKPRNPDVHKDTAVGTSS